MKIDLAVVEGSVSDSGRTTSFLIGVGIGIGVGLLFAPRAGEDTRDWIAEIADDKLRFLRRKGRRLLFDAQTVLDRGEEAVTKVLKTGKNALDSVASTLE